MPLVIAAHAVVRASTIKMISSFMGNSQGERGKHEGVRVSRKHGRKDAHSRINEHGEAETGLALGLFDLAC